MNNCQFSRQYENPIEHIYNLWGNINIDHITYDPKLYKSKYYIIKQHAHDGTFLFTRDLIQAILHPIISKRSYYKTDKIDNIKNIKYTIGSLKVIKCYGNIWLPISLEHTYPGLKERMILPVTSFITYN